MTDQDPCSRGDSNEMSDVRWHYTCDHGAQGISAEGVVRPTHHHALGAALAWFTDLEGPAYRDELGLTSTALKCDRMAYRFAVAHPDRLLWWPKAARILNVPRKVRAELEAGRLPAHWWVSFEPVEVRTVVLSGESG
jgi:hypothetical protein